MNKIPVGQTIRFAYAFTFGEIGTVIGLVWIPTLLQAIASFFILGAYYPVLADALDAGAAPTGPAALLPLLLVVVSMITMTMVGVAISQQVLGLRSGPVFAHLAFGSAEFKVFGGYFFLYGLVILSFFVLLMIAGAISAVGGAPAAALAFVVAMLGGLAAAIYAITRLSYLLAPTVLDGADFGVLRSWQLTRGNFWRIFVVALATLLPISIVIDIVSSVLLGPVGPQTVPPATVQAMLHSLAVDLRDTLPHMPVLIGVGLVLSPLTYGLLFAPAAFAFRVLSGKTAFGARE
jgi:hypothetical protein